MMYLAAHLGASRTPVFSSWTLPGLIDSSSSSSCNSDYSQNNVPKTNVSTGNLQNHASSRSQLAPPFTSLCFSFMCSLHTQGEVSSATSSSSSFQVLPPSSARVNSHPAHSSGHILSEIGENTLSACLASLAEAGSDWIITASSALPATLTSPFFLLKPTRGTATKLLPRVLLRHNLRALSYAFALPSRSVLLAYVAVSRRSCHL
ncbi:hypothetical protein K435DRAFT_964173 [Dendrothele bispora CBS 962.96]|uniref:Uncharacterized protein n=1 Tax=Dendrothele bispora (strain CBS 962.96) TaxID=1314807 RepID=A0A4V4HGU1_DENBC|nr:hypothetical protein K435DRAFT_964173 [Dendrothele bispora CBS 962.96]